MDKGKTQDFIIFSKELDEKIEVLVYLPPQFTPFTNYSYCIAQDGKDYFQLGRIARTLDQLINEGEIEPIIFFGIPYKDVHDRRKKYHPMGENHKKYIRFLVHELLPFIEYEFPVLHVGQSRALAGDSLAATLSLLAALEYPNTFGKLMLHSPYVDKMVINEVQKFDKWDLLTIYHAIGKQESIVHLTDGKQADFLTPNQQLMELIQQNPLQYYYKEFDGNHTWKYWQEDLKHALTKLFPY